MTKVRPSGGSREVSSSLRSSLYSRWLSSNSLAVLKNNFLPVEFK